MLLSNFNYYKPKNLDEAYQLLNTCDDAALMAGGTDLLVEMKQGRRSHKNIISLNYIPELNIISEDNDYVYIGSAVTFRKILESDIIRTNIPELANAVSKIGSHQVRNLGTIGGNICTCASCADSVPVLFVYEAEVEVASANNNKRMALTDFLLNHHQTCIGKDEILIRIIVQKRGPEFHTNFQKFGLREASSISVASVAVGMSIENSIVTNSTIVVGACAPTPIKCTGASAKLSGQNIQNINNDSSILTEITNAVSSDISPINDIRGTADFRKEIVKTLARRAIVNASKKYIS